MSKNFFVGACGIFLGVIIAFILPIPKGLDRNAMIVLGTVIAANIFWIFKVIPNFATGLIMISTWPLLHVVKFEEAFGVFSTAAWWIVIGGLGIGAVASKTGLMKRLALNVMKAFPVSFKGQTLALFLAGIIISPAIPSTNAKGAMASPLAKSISDSLGYEPKSNSSAGIFLSTVWGFLVAAPIFLSATSTNYAIKGVLPQAVQSQISWIDWFLIAIPWGLVVMIGGYFFINFWFKPKNENIIPKHIVEKQLEELGPWTRDEIITVVVIGVTLFFWILERKLNISSSITAVISLGVLLGLKVMSPTEFRQKIAWDPAIFIGCAMSLGSVLGLVGVSDWLRVVLRNIITPVLSHPLFTVVFLAIVIYLAKIFLVSLITAGTIFLLVLIPFFGSLKYEPIILVFIVATSINVWFLPYMNPPYLTTSAAVDNSMANNKHAMISSFAYMILNVIGLLISVPYWKFLGLM